MIKDIQPVLAYHTSHSSYYIRYNYKNANCFHLSFIYHFSNAFLNAARLSPTDIKSPPVPSFETALSRFLNCLSSRS